MRHADSAKVGLGDKSHGCDEHEVCALVRSRWQANCLD